MEVQPLESLLLISRQSSQVRQALDRLLRSSECRQALRVATEFKAAAEQAASRSNTSPLVVDWDSADIRVATASR